jgi:hypothetical protein
MRKSIIVTVANKETGEILFSRRIGKLPKVKSKDVDLGTDNWGRFLSTLLSGALQNSSKPVTLKDTANTSRTTNVYAVASSYVIFGNTNYSPLNVTIAVGDNASSPSRADYNLKGNILGEVTVSASYVDGSGVVNVTVSLSFGSNVVVYEIGLFMELMYSSSSPYKFKTMLDRTVVSDGIPVNVGQTLNITYQIPI